MSAISKFSLQDASAALSGTAAVVLAANPMRQYLMIANADTSIAIWISFTATAAASGAGSFRLAAGEVREWSIGVPTNAVSAIAASATPNVTINWA